MADRVAATCACGASFSYESTDKFGYMYARSRFQEWIAVHNKCPEPKQERFRIDQSKRKR